MAAQDLPARLRLPACGCLHTCRRACRRLQPVPSLHCAAPFITCCAGSPGCSSAAPSRSPCSHVVAPLHSASTRVCFVPIASCRAPPRWRR